jgi:hypothetical protein
MTITMIVMVTWAPCFFCGGRRRADSMVVIQGGEVTSWYFRQDGPSSSVTRHAALSPAVVLGPKRIDDARKCRK